jgi:hypothetical protein
MIWLAREGKVPDKVWAMAETPAKNREHKRKRLLFIWRLQIE